MIAIEYVGFVGFNLAFDVHKKPDTFTLLNHYTVIMALAFRIIVKQEGNSTYCQQALFIVKVFTKCSLHCLLNMRYGLFYVIICVYTCRKPLVLEK